MRIAMVSEHASPLAALGGVDAGGQNVHVAELGTELARQGHDVTVYTRRDDKRLSPSVMMESGVRVAHVDAGPPRVMPKDELFQHMDAFAAQLHNAFVADPPDVVHAHFWMSGYATLKTARPLGIATVQTFHALGCEKRRHQGCMDTSPEERIDHERTIACSMDRVLATSSSEIFELRRMGANPRCLKLVPCGVNLAAFDATTGHVNVPRKQKYRIVSLSRLVERKGIADVIVALAQLPETELIVAGGGEAADLRSDPEAMRLRRIARGAGVADRVRFLGRIAHCEVPKLLRDADVVVCTPWYEPFGMVPLEAMACRVPVVASAVGGLNDTILDGVTGFHVSPRDPEAIAERVARLLASADLRRSFGEAGRQRVAARYTWQRIAKDTLRAYRGLGQVTRHVAGAHLA